MLISVYGSIKEGFHNHSWLGGATKIGVGKVSGVMYLVGGSYPKLFHGLTPLDDGYRKELDSSLEREHVTEIYNISDERAQMIEQIENSAGYETEHISTAFGEAKIFICPPASFSTNDKYIEAYTLDVYKR